MSTYLLPWPRHSDCHILTNTTPTLDQYHPSDVRFLSLWLIYAYGMATNWPFIVGLDAREKLILLYKNNKGANKSPLSSSGGEQRVRRPIPLKYHKNMGFLSKTGPDPLKNHKAAKPQISHCVNFTLWIIGTNSSKHVKNWHQYVTYFVPISHFFVKNVHEVKFYVAFMPFLYIDKMTPKSAAFLIWFQFFTCMAQFYKLGRPCVREEYRNKHQSFNFGLALFEVKLLEDVDNCHLRAQLDERNNNYYLFNN